jgi:DNA-binding response OmpR family regulator
LAKILLVDDDHDILELGQVLLQHAGHSVTVFDNAMGAFHFLRTNHVDVLISDVAMPEVTGFDLVRMIKLEVELEDLTIAMLTGHRERDKVEAAAGLGVHSYIVKPLDPQVFLKKIEDLLQKRPPREHKEPEFPTARVIAKAKLAVNLEIIAISELGITVRSPHRFEAGVGVRLDAEILREIGIGNPRLKVFISEEVKGGWETRLSFVSIDDVSLQRLRLWVANQPKQPRTIKVGGKQRRAS